MSVLEEYVTLYEKKWQSVFAGWKILQITIYFIIALAGILASFCLSKLAVAFNYNCLLNSNISLIRVKEDRRAEVDWAASSWGKSTNCAYCQYVPVCSVIFASMWLTFFMMCGRGGRSDHGLPQPWRIVYPAMVFNTIYLCIAAAAVGLYEDGYYTYCVNLVSSNKLLNCNDVQHYSFQDTSGNDVVHYLILTRIGLWGICLGWLLGVLLLVMRCCFMADFTVMKISVVGATPVEEEDRRGLLQAPKASPESVHLSPEEKACAAMLNVPAIL